jgi:hypothetical protein
MIMVQEGDLCPTCGVGKIHAFQCDSPDCGAKWDAISKTKYKIESRDSKKQDEKSKSDHKGMMKKMKNTAKPRRQDPR